MSDTEFDPYTRDDLVAEVKATRLKFKEQVIVEVARPTEIEQKSFAEAEAAYVTATREAAELPLIPLLQRLDSLLSKRPPSGSFGMHSWFEERWNAERARNCIVRFLGSQDSSWEKKEIAHHIVINQKERIGFLTHILPGFAGS